MAPINLQIQKEDGRYLVYYHFPDSATEEQSAVFRSADAAPPAAGPAVGEAASSPPQNSNKEKPSV